MSVHSMNPRSFRLALLLACAAVLALGCKSERAGEEGADEASEPALEAEVAEYYMGAGEALIAALEGEPYDVDTYGPRLEDRVTELAKTEFEKLGDDPQIMLVTVGEIEAGQVRKSTGGYLRRAHMYVLPSGALRYGFFVFEASGKGSYRPEAVDTPRGKGTAHLLAELAKCTVPLMRKSETASLPDWIIEDMSHPPRADDDLEDSIAFQCKRYAEINGELGPGKGGGGLKFFVKGSDAWGVIRATNVGNRESERFGLSIRRAGCTQDTVDECEKGKTFAVERVVQIRN